MNDVTFANNFESFHADVALARYVISLSSVRQLLSTSPMEIPAGLQGWDGWGWVGVWDRKIEDVQYVTLDSR